MHVSSLLHELANTDDNEFVSFVTACNVDEVLSYLQAFLIALSTVRLWNLMNFGEQFKIFELTLLAASKPVFSITIVAIIVMAAYSSCAFILMGFMVPHFRDTYHCLSTFITFSLGFNKNLDFQTFLNAGSFFGPLLYFSFSVITCVYVMNMFVTVMVVTYGAARVVTSCSSKTYNVYHFLVDEVRYCLHRGPTNHSAEEEVIRLRGGADDCDKCMRTGDLRLSGKTRRGYRGRSSSSNDSSSSSLTEAYDEPGYERKQPRRLDKTSRHLPVRIPVQAV